MHFDFYRLAFQKLIAMAADLIVLQRRSYRLRLHAAPGRTAFWRSRRALGLFFVLGNT